MAETAMSRETLVALRKTISRIENEPLPGLARSVAAADPAGFRRPTAESQPGRKVVPLGAPDLDRILEGGLPLEGLTEIRASQTRDAGCAAGFALALTVLCQSACRNSSVSERAAPVLWIGQPMAAMEAGHPYAVGLRSYGLDIGRFVFAAPRSLEDALWIAEAALGVGAFAAVVFEVRGNPSGLGLSESRRLHMRARSGGLPFLVLRQAGEQEASSALFRLHVRPAPAARRPLPDGSMLGNSIGNPVFQVTVEKSRVLSSTVLFLEWNSHDRRFRQHDADAIAVPADATHSGAGLSLSSGQQAGAGEMGKRLAFKRAS